MRLHVLAPLVVLSFPAGCGPNSPPNTSAAGTVQQTNKLEQGALVSVRNVAFGGLGTIGTVTGAAAEGLARLQGAPSPISAFTALGGGITGSAMGHTTGAFEYIVRKVNGDLVSVTQKDKTPLALGQKVLVIAGSQARVVPDDTVPPLTPAAAMAGTPSISAVAPAASADTRPEEPARADSTPETIPTPAATMPATPAAARTAKPAATLDHAS